MRRYRVWWLDGHAEAVPVVGRQHRRAITARLLASGGAAACLLCEVPVAGGPWLLALLATGLLAGGRIAWSRHRARRLRRLGARPGPWVWAIDAQSAACTACIRASLPVAGDQARRTPSIRIQSPSCSQRRSSNHAA